MKPMSLRALIVVCALAGCAVAPASTGTPGEPAGAGTPAQSPSRAAASPSPTAQSALDLLQCTAAPSSVGGFGEDVAPFGGGETPEAALEAFLSGTPYVIPVNDYQPLARSGDRHAYGYAVDGEVKVVIVVSSRFGALIGTRYTVDELRTCAEAEFGSDAVFFDARRVWTHQETGAILTDIAGPGHCGWQSARMLHLELPDGVRQYLRDPEGVLAGARLLDTYAERVELPPDARFSGYRTADGLELWFTDSDTAAYVVARESVERWPRAGELIGCA